MAGSAAGGAGTALVDEPAVMTGAGTSAGSSPHCGKEGADAIRTSIQFVRRAVPIYARMDYPKSTRRVPNAIEEMRAALRRNFDGEGGLANTPRASQVQESQVWSLKKRVRQRDFVLSSNEGFQEDRQATRAARRRTPRSALLGLD